MPMSPYATRKARALRRSHERPSLFEPLEPRLLLSATYEVNTLADSGAGSLRQAIIDANAHPNDAGVPDLITFNIPGDAPHTIAPATALPAITDPVTIDGTTEPGFAGTPLIVLDGGGATGTGLALTAGGSIVRGLVIHRWSDSGVAITGAGGNIVAGNFIGVDVTGTNARGNGVYGVRIVDAADNRIGGTAAGEGNVISASFFAGVELSGAATTGNRIEGNLIGTDVTGHAAVGNLIGLRLTSNAANNIIGGTDPGAGNVISGNGPFTPAGGGTGIMFNGAAAANQVAGNYIGTNAAGTAALPNAQHGISVGYFAHDNVIGGSAPGAGNLISGNAMDGIDVWDQAYDNAVKGNWIGTNPLGADIGNGGTGVLVASSAGGAGWNNLIGGAESGAGNVIAYSGGGGAAVGAFNTDVLGNTIADNTTYGVFVNDSATQVDIRTNRISGNGWLGIKLAFENNLPLPNDPGDIDSGANGRQNYPVITQARSDEVGTIVIDGTLNTTASTAITIDFYANDAADPTGFGEGQTYLGSAPVTTDGAGNVSFTATLAATVPVGKIITSTATGPDGTSEFSGDAAGPPVVTLLNDPPLITAWQAEPAIVDEGGAVTFTGSFTDADAANTHTIAVDFGDGQSEMVTLTVGARGFSVTHTYADDGLSPAPSDLYSVQVSVTDGAASDDAATTVTVDNVPPTAEAGGPYAVDDGATVALAGAASDPAGDDDPITFAWDLDGDGNFGETGAPAERGDETGPAPTFDAAGIVGPTEVIVTLQATDDDGQSGTDTATITVHAPPNTPPTVDPIDGPEAAVRFQTVTFHGSFSDPDTGDTHTSAWQIVGPEGYVAEWGQNVDSVDFTPQIRGVFTIRYTVTDSAPSSHTATLNLAVSAAGIQADPVHPGEQALFVGGSKGSDSMLLSADEGQSIIRMIQTDLSTGQTISRQFPGEDIRRAVVYGGKGNDQIFVAGPLTVELYGGPGNDLLAAAGGHDIIDGGPGRDLIAGGAGRDIMIGGPGSDRLLGAYAQDILIGGIYRHAGDRARLAAIRSVWIGPGTYLQRIDWLQTGIDSPITEVLNDETVGDDQVLDWLWGMGARDWFLASDQDITDERPNEVVTEIDALLALMPPEPA